MIAAIDEALGDAASAAGEVPVGAVIVLDGVVIARSGNRNIVDADPTAHAEVNVIRSACKALGSAYLTDCDLYVTLEPCAMCAAAISFARIKRLIFGAYDMKYGAVESATRLYSSCCTHVPEVYGGIYEAKCRQIMQGFFQEIRKQ